MLGFESPELALPSAMRTVRKCHLSMGYFEGRRIFSEYIDAVVQAKIWPNKDFTFQLSGICM
jgi:hypothetical protein